MLGNNITSYQLVINENNQLINENNNEGYITFFIRCWKPRNILKKIAILISNLETLNETSNKRNLIFEKYL